jgi:Type III restriction enzyme, res subunit
MQDASVWLRPFAVCSDVRVGRRQTEDMGVVDLAEPATTNASKLMERMARSSGEGRITVVFSTYQSIEVVAAAQGLGLGEFDLVVCDEAHRTTGVTLTGEDESAFVRVHDRDFLTEPPMSSTQSQSASCHVRAVPVRALQAEPSVETLNTDGIDPDVPIAGPGGLRGCRSTTSMRFGLGHPEHSGLPCPTERRARDRPVSSGCGGCVAGC